MEKVYLVRVSDNIYNSDFILGVFHSLHCAWKSITSNFFEYSDSATPMRIIAINQFDNRTESFFHWDAVMEDRDDDIHYEIIQIPLEWYIH